MQLVDIRNGSIIVELDRWDAMRLAATLMRGRDDDYTFAVTSAGLLEAAALVSEYQNESHVPMAEVALSDYRKKMEKDYITADKPRGLPVAS